MRARRLVCGLSLGLALTAAAPAPAVAMTRAEAAEVARAINLVDADLPGYSSSPQETTSADRRENARLARCAGMVPPRRALVNTPSSSFDYFDEATTTFRFAISSVTVMPNAALARRDLRAGGTRRARRCLARALAKELEDPEIDVVGVSVRRLPAPAPGILRLRGVIRLAASGVGMRSIFDIFGFARGPGLVSLTVTAMPGAFPSSTAGELFALLQSRAAQALP